MTRVIHRTTMMQVQLVGLVCLAALCAPALCSPAGIEHCDHSNDLYCLLTFRGLPPSCPSPSESTPPSLFCRAAAFWLRTLPDTHKPLLPLNSTDIAGFVLAAVALFFAAGGGLGGGGLLIPIYLIVLQFSTRMAVALSNITIVGGAFANLALNIGRKHPLRPGPLIDWDIILVMEPATILGALLGTYANKVLAAWITTTLLAIVLCFMTYTLVKKGIHGWSVETARKAAAAHGGPGAGHGAPGTTQHQQGGYLTRGSSLTAPLLAADVQTISGGDGDDDAGQQSVFDGHDGGDVKEGVLGGDGRKRASFSTGPDAVVVVPDGEHITNNGERITNNGEHITNNDNTNTNDTTHDGTAPVSEPGQHDDEQNNEGSEPSQHSPLHSVQSQKSIEVGPAVRDVRQFSRTWSVQRQQQLPPGKIAVLAVLFIGVALSEILKGTQPCGSLGYWISVLAVLLPVLPIMYGSRQFLLRKHKERIASNAPWVEGDVKWDERGTIVYPAVSTLAGLFAGLFGIGGGIVKGPLMLEMGVLPDVAAATSATMILMTSSSACLVYFTFGTLQYDYAAVLATVGFLTTFLGQLVVYKLIKLLGRRSIIVFAMALFMAVSSVVVAWQALKLTSLSARAHELWHWGHICD